MRIDKEMHFHTQSHTLILACICLIALAAMHCGGGEDRAYSRGSTVIVAHPENDPLIDQPAEFLVFLPLVKFNEHGELEGRLARSWEHSPDYREWTFHLRTDVRWNDGTPVTAHDLKFSMELLTHPDVLGEDPGHFGSITVLDDSTLKAGIGGMDTDVVYYPKHLLEELDPKEFYNWDFWYHPVGNGPYRFVRYVPQTMMEFQANPDYYKGKPKIERVVLKFVGDDALTELLSGNVDAIMETNPVHIPMLAADPRFRAYHSYNWWIQWAIYWQNDHPLFRDPGVRRALTLAINRQELLQVLNLPEYVPVVDGPYTFRQLQRGQLPEPLPYDPARARALLDAAGWRDRDGDGMREQNGQLFRFTVLVASIQPNKEIAVYIQAQLRRVGVEMSVQILPNLNVLEKVKTGKFEAALAKSTPGTLGRFSIGEGFPLGYKNAALVALYKQIYVEDPDAQDRIRREVTDIFREDVPVTFLCPSIRTLFVHRRIQGLSSPWRADPVLYMEHLWPEEED